MNKIILTMAMVASVGLAGCDTVAYSGQKEKIGAISGAVLGGVLGSNVGGGKGQLVATGIGVLVGTLVGSELGRSLDKADMVYASQANAQAHSAPIGNTISWNNPTTGNSGAVTPVRDGNDSAGRYCREYQQTIYVGGQEETGVGIACEQPDGTWKIAA